MTHSLRARLRHGDDRRGPAGATTGATTTVTAGLSGRSELECINGIDDIEPSQFGSPLAGIVLQKCSCL